MEWDTARNEITLKIRRSSPRVRTNSKTQRQDRRIRFVKDHAAITKAGIVTGEFSEREAKKLTLRVLTLAHELRLGPTPKVEEIQDIVEVLLASPSYKTAKA